MPMPPDLRYVDLAAAAPTADEAVVVIDVLRAFTVVPWLFARGAQRVLAVATHEQALRLRAQRLPDALLAGEHGGRPYPDFDLGNSPTEVAGRDLAGATVVHRTSAGTQGLVATIGSGLVVASAFVTVEATVRQLLAADPSRVTFVITGASLGRDGDEDLACAELIAARLRGERPEPAPFLARVARSDHGRLFAPDGPTWATREDLDRALELDRFDRAVLATPVDDAVELSLGPAPPPGVGH